MPGAIGPGLAAARFGWTAYIVPFLFVLSPTLLLIGRPMAIALAVLTALLGIWLVSIALAVAGSVLALTGGVALYLREEVFDADAFADNAAETLKDGDVREELEEPIVDQAIDRGPDVLINARPVLVAAVDGVLGSTPFRSVFRKGARKLHRAVFSKDREQIAFTVEIGRAHV